MRQMLALLFLALCCRPAGAADTAPFYPMNQQPYRMAVSTTATQYAVTLPNGASSFRFVNPCNVDVRLGKVPDLNTSIDMATGRLFLARTVEIMATVNPQFVSLIAMSDPGTAGCIVEMQYGTGN